MYIGLLDCNNFFVSCERLFRPDLLCRPVVVLSSNDGCVVARSKEVKEAGIPMGVPHFKIRDELKRIDAHVFSSNFPLYRDISFRVMDVLAREAVRVEQYSVDEAFFILPEKNADAAHAEATRLKRTVEREVGVPVTVGVARTKTIAKCASELGKRTTGVMVLAEDTWREVRQRFPLADVWGIGGKTAAKMRAEGLVTVSDLLEADSARVQALFGVHGARLRYELSEVPSTRTHDPDELQQSIMSTRSFGESTTERAVLADALAYHVAHAAEELRALGACAQGLRVLIRPSRHGDWSLRGGTREALLVAPTDDTRTLLKEAMCLLDTLFERGVPYKKAGAVLTHLVPRTSAASSLFEPAAETSKLFGVVDTLNRRFGSGTLTIGRTRSTERFATSRAHLSPRYTTDWNEVPRVMS